MSERLVEETPTLTASNVYLVESTFKIENDPGESMLLDVVSSMDRTCWVVDSEEQRFREVVLTVEIKLVCADDQTDVRLRGSATVACAVHSVNNKALDATSATREGIVAAYGLARSYLLTTTAFSPAGGISIPEIDPDKVIAAYGRSL